jgi:hypothetical protein
MKLRSGPSLAVWLVIVWLLGVLPCVAYPIPPVPLWELLQKSDLVLLAKVVEVDPIAEQEDGTRRWDSAIARLQVVEVWKGEPTDRVEVPYPANLLCPAPPRYEKGETVLAFLARSEEGTWATVGLSYGTLYPQTEEVEDYRAAIRDASVLMKGETVSLQSRLEWLSAIAARRGTRWHGLYELEGRSDKLHSYYDRSGASRALAASLSEAQRARIARGFVDEPSTDRTLPMALSVLADFKSREVDLAAASAIESVLKEEEVPWWIPDALGLTLKRFGDPDVDKRLAHVGRDFADVDAEEVRRIWREACSALGIPRVAPIGVPKPKVWGVGSNTPS